MAEGHTVLLLRYKLLCKFYKFIKRNHLLCWLGAWPSILRSFSVCMLFKRTQKALDCHFCRSTAFFLPFNISPKREKRRWDDVQEACISTAWFWLGGKFDANIGRISLNRHSSLLPTAKHRTKPEKILKIWVEAHKVCGWNSITTGIYFIRILLGNHFFRHSHERIVSIFKWIAVSESA